MFFFRIRLKKSTGKASKVGSMYEILGSHAANNAKLLNSNCYQDTSVSAKVYLSTMSKSKHFCDLIFILFFLSFFVMPTINRVNDYRCTNPFP